MNAEFFGALERAFVFFRDREIGTQERIVEIERDESNLRLLYCLIHGPYLTMRVHSFEMGSTLWYASALVPKRYLRATLKSTIRARRTEYSQLGTSPLFVLEVG